MVSGLNWSASRVTEQNGRASAMQTAVEKPITPAPTTATLTLFILELELQQRKPVRRCKATFIMTGCSEEKKLIHNL